MGRRESLRALQERLLARMQAARLAPPTPAWLAVEVAGQGVLLPLAQAGEIFPEAVVMPLPHTRSWFQGVANLRGDLHGVIDLAEFLGLRPGAERPGPQREEPRPVVAFSRGLAAQCALRIDALVGLRPADRLMPAVVQAGTALSWPGLAGAWQDAEGRTWLALDLAALAANEEFLAIAA